MQPKSHEFNPWGSGISPGGGHDNPLQYPLLENPMDRGTWKPTVHGIAKNWTWLKWLEVAQSCLTLCDPMDCSLSGFSVHGISQARVLEWIAISFFRGSSWPRDWTKVSHIVGRCFTILATREVLKRLNTQHIAELTRWSHSFPWSSKSPRSW